MHASDAAENFCRSRARWRQKRNCICFLAEIAFGSGDEFDFDWRIRRWANPLDKNHRRRIPAKELQNLTSNHGSFGYRLHECFQLDDVLFTEAQVSDGGYKFL